MYRLVNRTMVRQTNPVKTPVWWAVDVSIEGLWGYLIASPMTHDMLVAL